MKNTAPPDLFRRLPAVDEVMRATAIVALSHSHGHELLARAVRTVLAKIRHEITSGLLDSQGLDLALSGLSAAVEGELRRATTHSLRAVINATGVILHTNLGRAPLSQAAIDHIRETATRYSNLEFDLAAGVRGKRDIHVDRLFRQVLSAEKTSTIVVNNNAAAVLLALNTLAEGGEVIVSRGELVEIGGSFRIPDVMAKSGAILREIGTTNRTRIADYEKAITERTRLLLRVHRSNFEISGFTEQAALDELVDLARQRGIPLMEDLGSGALIDLRSLGIERESSVIESLAAGVDIVTYSGDKMLGGPQAGILSGRPDLIARMRSNSLFRALRVDKLTYAALEATLLAYLKGEHNAVPTLRMMRYTKEEIGLREQAVAAKIGNSRIKTELIDGDSLLGGGAAPSSVLPTRLLSLSCEGFSADELAAQLRRSDPPIIVRIDEGRVLLDLRTVFPDQDAAIAYALNRIA
ncbi:MAG TPA: L-seryl-tRNA(Sec) selenium transferase [Candidatus Binatia bacterium]|nr:L-seryl-tRNA(Sec) selenium transferase [Candidatus Binatia bacterium]